MHLRTLIRIFATAISAITLISAVALISTSNYLHRLTQQIENNLESVRAAEEIELHLLWQGRNSHLAALTGQAEYAVAAKDAEQSVQQWRETASRYVGSPEESRTLALLGEKVDRYFAEHALLSSSDKTPLDVYIESAPSLHDAYSEAENLLKINLDQASAAGRESARWDSIANTTGVGVALLLIVTVVFVIVGARVRIYQPLIALRRTIGRLGTEGYSVRADEGGPLEIGEIAHTFNKMAAMLERQRQNQLAFLAAVAHDLRTPLGAVKMAVSTLSHYDSSAGSDRVASTLGVVGRQVDLLARLISDLLDATRIEGGHFTVLPEECDAREFVQNVVDLFRASSTLHELVVRVPDEPIIARCDPARIEQVMNNLVSNAIKYSPSGGRVEVIAEGDGRWAILSVRDEGLGIPVEEQNRIFEPFRRGDSSREIIAGVGLGLSVARRIIEAHGGTIAVLSAPGQGSTFTVHLPLASAQVGRMSARIGQR